MNKQLNHTEYNHEKKKFAVTIVLDNIEHPENVGSAFLLADALGAEKLIILDDKDLNKDKSFMKKVSKTSRNCENIVSFEIMKTEEFIKAKPVKIVALEITNTSVPLGDIVFSSGEHIFLVVGNEREGVGEKLLALADLTIHIPMCGVNSSMNVSTALAIALYEIVKPQNQNSSLDFTHRRA